MTFRHEGVNDGLTNPAEIRGMWDRYAKVLAEPFRSALLSLPKDAAIWCERLAQWPTVAWDNKQGTITLAGDAAHPMTYRKPAMLLHVPYVGFSPFRSLIFAYPFLLGLTLDRSTCTDRGQGLNNAVHDAGNLCQALDEFMRGEMPVSDAIAAYETELVERGREAVVSSGQNSIMCHDWEQLQNSPLFKQGLVRRANGGH